MRKSYLGQRSDVVVTSASVSEADNGPQTLSEALDYFADADRCWELTLNAHWPTGVSCPRCGSKNVRFVPRRRLWECAVNHPARQFSTRVGTLFERSPIGMKKWLGAIWLIANSTDRVSSRQLQRAVGVTQKTAWYMLKRLEGAIKVANREDAASGASEK